VARAPGTDPPSTAGRPFGPYELLEEISRGGMGIVYKARQTGLDRTVALKMILAGAAAQRAEVLRFQREARAPGRLRHPNIIAVHDAGQIDGQHYFTMPLARNGSLAKHVKRLSADARAAVALVEKVARAVHHLHEHDILHRDLKPANILLDDGDEPWVADFGLARFLDNDEALTRTGRGLGTPAYMAPEQADRKHGALGPAADVWALGVILYELLAGRRPFRGRRESVIHKIQQDDPPPPSRWRPGLDPNLEAVILNCLAREPARRYASAGALADDLRAWLRGEPLSVRPEGPLGRARRWVRRRAWPLAAAALCLSLGVLFAALRGPAPPEKPASLKTPGTEVVLPGDPPGALAPIEETLAAGRERTLIGERGGPAWHRWPLEPGKFLPAAPPDEPFQVTAFGFGLMELVPDPQRPRFRLEAKVKVMEPGGEAGLVFGYQPWKVEDMVQHLYWVLSVGDSRPGIRGLRLRRVRWFLDPAKAVVNHEAAVPFVEKVPFNLTVECSLAVEVTPQGIAVFFDGKEVGRFSDAKLQFHTHVVSDDLPQPLPDVIHPRGGLGLYIRETKAEFRDVVVRPLPGP
jgi:serine/threonine-protein kinase